MPLINSIAELRSYINININTEWGGIQPFVDEAELLLIIPLLGPGFYAVLLADYTTNGQDITAMTPDNQAIMPYIQRCLSFYAMYFGIDQIVVQVGDAGINELHGDNSSPAPKWKIDSLKLHYIRQGDLHAEKLLAFLEENATASKYADWFNDLSVNTRNEGFMVNNTREASRWVDINNSRRIFLRMKKRIIQIEQRYAKSLVCPAQYDELVAQIQGDTLTTENTALIEKLRPIITKKALYETIPFVRLSIEPEGIMIYSITDLFTSRNLAERSEVDRLLKTLRDGEMGYDADEADFKQFIIDNIADYPLIEDSPAYTVQPDPGPRYKPENSADSKHFAV